MRNVSDKHCRESQIHILCSVTPPENLTVHEVIWENVVELDRPQMSL